MNNNLCCVAIPIYKEYLIEYEIVSLEQCCKILKNHPIVFVTHDKLDCGVYDVICRKYGISYKYEYFNQIYFTNLYGYNALMLSKIFYKRFIDYKYILIYQLDAYVFKDELEYWCNTGYDYIGAPWYEISELKTMPKFRAIHPIGNGGFSLRNIEKFIKLHDISIYIIWFLHMYTIYYDIVKVKSRRNKIYFILRILLCFILRILRFFFRKNEGDDNEDYVWSKLLYKKGCLPSTTEAIKFSFEYFLDYLYDANNNILPFGCHAWYKDCNFIFWKKFISTETTGK